MWTQIIAFRLNFIHPYLNMIFLSFFFYFSWIFPFLPVSSLLKIPFLLCLFSFSKQSLTPVSDASPFPPACYCPVAGPSFSFFLSSSPVAALSFVEEACRQLTLFKLGQRPPVSTGSIPFPVTMRQDMEASWPNCLSATSHLQP